MREHIDHANHLCRIAFVPHEENAFRPHILHPKRTVGYLIAFTVMKVIVLGLVVVLPASIFASTEAVQVQERELVRLVNAERAAVGVPPLADDVRLDQSSKAKSADMFERQYFAHVNSDGEGPGRFASRAGYPYSIIGENLAMGFVAAEDIVSAWRQSPLHARNMQEAAFADTGLSVIGGTYLGTPTMFVTQHFGKQRLAAATGSTTVAGDVTRETPASMPTPTARPNPVQPKRAPENTETDAHVRSASLEWRANGDAQTAVTAKANIVGAVVHAQVTVRGETIPLERVTGTPNAYAGTATLPESSEDVFRVVVPATLSVTDASGQGTTQDVPWEAPAIVSPSLTVKYAQAKTLLPETFGPVFSVARTVYGIAFMIFALAWLVNLLVEIRRQHLDLLVPGGALVLLLAFYWMV